MPELPEVEALAQDLGDRLVGRELATVELAAVHALKTVDPPLSALVGRTVAGVTRRGKFLCVGTAPTPPVWLVVHLARGGWVRWREELRETPVRARRGPLALRVGLVGGGGVEVTEAGTEKRLALWVVHRPEEVPALGGLGPDPLAPEFDVAALGAALRSQRGNLKGVLTDQRVVAGVGNAYSDEALHAARLSPFKPAAGLSEEEVARLHAGLVSVLQTALERDLGRPASELKAEKRAGLAVHGRTGEPCPRCGDTVREVAFAARSLQYCPRCQTGGRVLADRRLSRLVK
ncbi:MAG TPA: DNA-formamidopyrimidine glycosylase family protein [Acidimicrobiales bacterium]|nr:DNA-formamidopyrimidine glycosylase family protein [Acidimicrobiales bacterium]